MRLTLLSLIAICLVGLTTTVAAQEKPAEAVAATPEQKAKILNEAQPYDVVYGDPDSKVRLVEYASLSCHHCKDFKEEVFDKLKKDYIDTKKIAFIYRHYPLNAPAFRAAKLVECATDEKRKKLFISALFKSQPDWAFSETEIELVNKLTTIAKIGGLKEADILSCLEDKELEEKMLAMMLVAQNMLQIGGTPAVFINGEVQEGANKEYDAIKAKLDKLLAE